MGTYVRSLTFPNEARTLDLAYPEPPARGGTINVVCGPNNAGKSFFLQRIRKILTSVWDEKGPPANQDIRISCTGDRQPRVLPFDESTRHKSKAGTVFLGLKKARLVMPGNYPDYRRTSLQLLLQQVNAHLPEEERIEAGQWLEYSELRKRSVEHFEPENTLYLCRREDPVVAHLEELLDASLYFRRSRQDEGGHHFEFVLLFGDGTSVPYSEWSEGQQACFYIINANRVRQAGHSSTRRN